jgi:hypothetical protein
VELLPDPEPSPGSLVPSLSAPSLSAPSSSELQPASATSDAVTTAPVHHHFRAIDPP